MTIRDHLMAIYERHGYLTPELVVEEARPVEHPLHGSVFDRSPEEAADAWYRHRAHELIQTVRTVYKHAPGDLRSIRAFHAIRADDERQYLYRPIEEIAQDPVATEMLLRDAQREWKQLQARYGHLREFVAMVAESLAVPA